VTFKTVFLKDRFDGGIEVNLTGAGARN